MADRARNTSSYSPYSQFSVGAVIETASGKFYTGGNVENASYGLCICAERVAAVKAVSEGEKAFKFIAVVGGKHGEAGTTFCSPCGACRQFLNEFDDDAVIIGRSEGSNNVIIHKLADLLPHSFGPKNLGL